MTKPIMNLDEVQFDDEEENGYFTSQRGTISDLIGAKKLGYNLTVLAPGSAQCPFHNHHGEEEMFFILEGEGELRFGDQRYPIRKHDVIACPTGGPEVAHQIINTGTEPMRYLALSNLVDIETCEFQTLTRCSSAPVHEAVVCSARCFAPRIRSSTMIARITSADLATFYTNLMAMPRGAL